MTQSEAVFLWKKGALDALDSAERLFFHKRYDHALFFLHLAIEKVLKSLFVFLKDEAPPYSHNLTKLAHDCNLPLTDKEQDLLDEITGFNISGRYEDYKLQLYHKATKTYTADKLKAGKALFAKYLSKIKA